LKKAKEAGLKPDPIKTQPSWLDRLMAGEADPDAGNLAIGESRKFEREAYNADERVPRSAPPPPVTTQAQVEASGDEDGGSVPVKIPRPKADWATDDLEKFAKSKGFAVSMAEKRNPEKLLEIALKAHENHCKRLIAGNVEFEEV